jgi:tetratricopeptide (TPR) repeat protein
LRTLLRLGAGGALLALLWPEGPRYVAERRLRKGTDELRNALATSTSVELARPAVDRAATLGISAMAGLPEDPRPRLLAGSARLVAGRPLEALDFSRDALATGERAEIDLNAGRAHALAGERPEAQAALLRALWISPALASAIPEPLSGRILQEVGRLEVELRAGRLATPPPMPE